MKNIILNIEKQTLTLEKFNKNLTNYNYNELFITYSEILDKTLILNNLIWSPVKLMEFNGTNKETLKLMRAFEKFIENSVNTMNIFIKNKPKNNYTDFAFYDLFSMLNYYFEKMKNNNWFSNKKFDSHAKHELKSLNLYLFSSFDLVANIIYRNHKNYNLDREKKIKFKDHILKYSIWFFKEKTTYNKFFIELWKSKLWEFLKDNRNEIAHNYKQYYTFDSLTLSHCLFILISRILLWIDLELRNNSQVMFIK